MVRPCPSRHPALLSDYRTKTLDIIESDDEAKQYGFKHGPVKVLNHDFVLLTEKEAAEARKKVTEANILKNTNFVWVEFLNVSYIV